MSEFSFLKATRWHSFNMRKRRPFFVDFWIHDLAHPSTDIGFDYRIQHIGHFKDEVLLDQESFTDQRASLLRSVENDPFFLKRLLDNAQRHFDDILFPYYTSISGDSGRAPTELATTLETYRRQMSQYCAYLLLPLYVEDELTNECRDGLGRLGSSEDAGVWFEAATSMVEEGLIAQEQRRLLELAVQPESALTTQVFTELAEQFSWMSNQLYWMQFHADDYYRERIAHLRNQDPVEQLAAMDRSLVDRRLAYQEVLDKLEHNEPLKAVVETLQAAVWFRNFRAERLYQGSYYLRPTLQAAAKVLGLTEQEVVWYTTPELVAALRNESSLDRSKIDERQAGFALMSNIHNDEVVAGANLEALTAAMHLDQAESTELSGHTAYPGKVTGPAFVVHDVADLDQVPDGSILITHATSPVYVPVLKRVIGVVTEEGGVLSHAAMIAREFKLPTLIGTKQATKQLQTGEVVEVNADAGTVRRINE
jgi:phosphohistidine swiveling domain-containing protein